MGAIKMLSANDVKRIAGISGRQYKKVQWHSAEIIVRPFLTIDEYMEVVRQIMRDCKGPDGKIVLELIDFAIRMNVICAYAAVELPDNMRDLYYIIYTSDLYNTIISAVNKNQIEEIASAVYANVFSGYQDGNSI